MLTPPNGRNQAQLRSLGSWSIICEARDWSTSPTIQEHTAPCLRNIEVILRAAGSSLDKAVSVTFVLGEESDFAGMNEEFGKWFAVDPPARQGAKLPIHPKGMKISIALIAEA